MARWMTMHIINISQKYVKHPIKERQLMIFPEEMETREDVDHEERMRMAIENIKFHKRKFWTKVSGSGLDGVKIFNEEDYERLMKKLRRDN